MHLPVNHPLRGAYRFMATLIGAYLVLFGVLSVLACSGQSFFARTSTTALGVRTNLAFGSVAVLIGLATLAVTAIGRRVYPKGAVRLGAGLVVLAVLLLTLMRTPANKLNASVGGCVVWMLLGVTLTLAGLYGKIGTREQARDEEEARHMPPWAVRPDADSLARLDPTK